jgi:hypothetical protein
MATTRKPAASSTTNKPTTARKPTTRKPAVKKTAPEQKDLSPTGSTTPVVDVDQTYTPEQKQALLETYFTLVNAGIPIPAEVQVVATWIAAQKEQEQRATQYQEEHEAQRVAQANIEGPWFVRNGYHAPFNFRLDRQTSDGGRQPRRVELKPRGVPGDLHPIKDEDLRDPVLIANVNLGLLEVIPAGEAQLIIEKQTHNSGQRVHTPLSIIQQEYAANAKSGMNVNPNPQFKVEAEYNQQGVTVAYTDPNVLQGNLTDTQVKRSQLGGLTRPGQKQAAPTVHSAFVPTGGHPAVVSSGTQGGVISNAQAKIADDIARRKTVHGPAAGLSQGLTVTVNPTQHT